MKKTVSFLCVILLLLCSCSKNDPSLNAARLRVKLTDAPAPIALKEMWLDLQAIEVAIIADAETEEWVPLKFSGGEYNILTLTNGKTVQLIDQYLPGNRTITKIKLVIGDKNRIVTTSSETKALILPPEGNHEIVLPITENLYANIISYLVIDINMLYSIQEKNGDFVFVPNFRVFSESKVGSIKGTIAPKEVKSIVAVVQDTDTFLTIPEEDGNFLFTGLREGEWEIGVFPIPESGFKDTIFVDTVSQLKTTVLKPNPLHLHPLKRTK